MKNVVFFLVIVAGLATFGLFSGCASSLVYGDRDLQSDQHALSSQIKSYQSTIDRLQSENTGLMGEMSQLKSDSTNQAALDQYEERLLDNKNLIVSYRSKKSFLENSLDSLLVRQANKDEYKNIKLSGGDPKEMAEAYAIIKYADGNGQVQTAPLIGLLRNSAYWDVVAQVSGPANFFRSYELKPGQVSGTFSLPGPGLYIARFVWGNRSSEVAVNVGPNIQYYYGPQKFDFMASLLP